jgi:membrane-bound lytic murein transglycosylase MltF
MNTGRAAQVHCRDKIVKLLLVGMVVAVPWLAAAVAVEAQTPPGSGQNTANGLALPLYLGKHVGDLGEMVKQHEIRVLVVYGKSSFFYDAGRPEGIFYETFEEFEKFVNQKLNTGRLKVNVTFLPKGLDQLEPALREGEGDLIGYAVMVTPEREMEALFTTPIDAKMKQLVVRGAKSAAIDNVEDLSGQEIYVNPVTPYGESLRKLNDGFVKESKAPIAIKVADTNLTDEDLIEMVNAGLIPATVALSVRAQFWAKVFPQIKVTPEIAVKEEGEVAFVTRKDSPKLLALLNEFVKGHAAGTSFGNTLIRRYAQNTNWVKDSTSTEEMKKFREYVKYFQKYAAQYHFDYLMLMAQGYQESRLDQSVRNPSGATGIMQVIPSYAAAPPISVPNVQEAEGNIQAGAKMLRNIVNTYLQDEKLDDLNRTLLAFASYNAGPSRIAALRKRAANEGLDPNRWFGNVELEAAKEIGQETVQYVGNIYKYYVAYKLVLEQERIPK